MVYAFLYTGIAIILLTTVGNRLCRLLFNLTGLKDATADEPEPVHSAGRVIGGLERLILAIGIVAHSGEILAAVVALKTLARFKQMDKREFAEYFLVGSLFSICWAMLVTGAWIAYDRYFGTDLMRDLITLFGKTG